jgi:Sulfotransferase domain
MSALRLGRSRHPASRDTSGSLRVAMWSGPRNISTAMMRAFENRSDCAVSDEPLYAAFLKQTGLSHPGADEVIAAGECDWRTVAEALTGPIPNGKSVWYQKHMSHHLLDGMDHAWIHRLTNLFLIRHPSAVVASYIRSRAEVQPEDIGLLQQAMLFDELQQASGQAPLVIDSAEFLGDPRAFLQALCSHVGIGFEDAMLRWPPGPRDSDGVWAKHWYHAVWNSSGFESRPERTPALSAAHQAIADVCLPAYEKLHAARLRL